MFLLIDSNMAFSAVLEKISEKNKNELEFDRVINKYIFAIIQEIQEQVPKNGLTVIKTPVERLTITRNGINYKRRPENVAEEWGDYNLVISKLGQLAIENKIKSDKYMGTLDILENIVKEKGYKVTGKYFPK